jgi:hypothetical protein
VFCQKPLSSFANKIDRGIETRNYLQNLRLFHGSSAKQAVKSVNHDVIVFIFGNSTIVCAGDTYLSICSCLTTLSVTQNIQNVPGGKVNILGGYGIPHSKKKVYMNMCPIPNGLRYLVAIF